MYRSKPKIPEYEYTLVTSKITKVCDKPATKTSKKKSSQPGNCLYHMSSIPYSDKCKFLIFLSVSGKVQFF